jgi:hypothetical protein
MPGAAPLPHAPMWAATDAALDPERFGAKVRQGRRFHSTAPRSALYRCFMQLLFFLCSCRKKHRNLYIWMAADGSTQEHQHGPIQLLYTGIAMDAADDSRSQSRTPVWPSPTIACVWTYLAPKHFD